jgi:hypothetical protein
MGRKNILRASALAYLALTKTKLFAMKEVSMLCFLTISTNIAFKDLTLLANTRIGRKNILRSNTLAYLVLTITKLFPLKRVSMLCLLRI